MAVVKWDRLMETCIKQGGTEVLLTTGSPPQLRVGGGLSALRLAPLSGRDIEELAESFCAPPAVVDDTGRYQYAQADGYLFIDVAYRDGHVFRAAVFGQPSPSLILLIRLDTVTVENRREGPDVGA